MEIYYSFSVLIVIATIFSYLNARFLKLPSTIGIMVITMVFSVGLVVFRIINPDPLQHIYELLGDIDFSRLLMGGMLYFLLFAGAIQIDINDLKEEKMPIIIFSSLSVLISTFVVGIVLYYALSFLMPWVGLTIRIPFLYCLLFGALISPTDAVAALSILKEVKVSKSLEVKVTGESLFNDGIAVITFTLIYSLARGTEQLNDISFLSVSWLLVKEVVGAFVVGIALGAVGYYAIKSAFEYKLSVLITISVVITGLLISSFIEISGPLTMVFAGLVIGNAGKRFSEKKKGAINFMKIFWELIDEVLNAVLFLLIGFELLLIPGLNHYWLIGLVSIVVVILARYISIKIPTLLIPFREKFTRGTIIILVWGGLRGGVSIALALSLSDSPYRSTIVAITYFVVVFSIIVQGLSIGKLARFIKV